LLEKIQIVFLFLEISSLPTNFKCVVFPEDGLGTGLAELPQRAPKTYAHLISAINSKFGDIYE